MRQCVIGKGCSACTSLLSSFALALMYASRSLLNPLCCTAAADQHEHCDPTCRYPYAFDSCNLQRCRCIAPVAPAGSYAPCLKVTAMSTLSVCMANQIEQVTGQLEALQQEHHRLTGSYRDQEQQNRLLQDDCAQLQARLLPSHLCCPTCHGDCNSIGVCLCRCLHSLVWQRLPVS